MRVLEVLQAGRLLKEASTVGDSQVAFSLSRALARNYSDVEVGYISYFEESPPTNFIQDKIHFIQIYFKADREIEDKERIQRVIGN